MDAPQQPEGTAHERADASGQADAEQPPSLAAPSASSLVALLTRLTACRDLPNPLPHEPMTLLTAWFDDARSRGDYEDFNAMTLATATPDGRPSARVLLCKAVEVDPPALVFYTNYESGKGRQLATNPRAAAVFHWPHAKRQVRVEGTIRRTTAEESDAYFDSRPLISRIGAIVSPQSQVIESRETLIAQALRVAGRAVLGAGLRRPDHWGGYRLLIESLELWSAAEGRLHDRAIWHRLGASAGDGWRAERLAP